MLVVALLFVIALLLGVVGAFLHLGEDVGGAFLGAIGAPESRPSYLHVFCYVAAFGCLIAAVAIGISHLSVHVNIN